MAQQLRTPAEDQSSVPTILMGGSQLPGTPAPEGLVSSSDLQTLHSHA